jgi:hypothetical protein
MSLRFKLAISHTTWASNSDLAPHLSLGIVIGFMIFPFVGFCYRGMLRSSRFLNEVEPDAYKRLYYLRPGILSLKKPVRWSVGI